jgi:hypothetical protein
MLPLRDDGEVLWRVTSSLRMGDWSEPSECRSWLFMTKGRQPAAPVLALDVRKVMLLGVWSWILIFFFPSLFYSRSE